MVRPIVFLALFALATITWPANLASAIGLQLGETKEELKLDYSVAVKDHGTGRVTVTFTLDDPGRLKPLTSIRLLIPSTEKHETGGFKSDLSLSLATRKIDGKQVASIHLKRDWAERAEIHLITAGLDGKVGPLQWFYHSIPIAPTMDDESVHRKQP